MIKSTFLLLLIVVTILISRMAEGADWVLLKESNIGTVYYDRAGIKQIEGDLVRVAVKYAYSTEGVEKFREAFPNVDPSDISYTVYVYEIDCSSGSFHLAEAATYASSGKVIRGTALRSEPEQSSQEHITPDSMMDHLATASCRWVLHSR